jgi:hypothetical protein
MQETTLQNKMYYYTHTIVTENHTNDLAISGALSGSETHHLASFTAFKKT